MLDPAEQWLVAQLRFDHAENFVLPSSIEWNDVVRAAQRHGLASIFLAEWGANVNLPPQARAELEKERYRILVDNTLHLRELNRWLNRLQVAEIPSVVLKGPALAATVYNETSLRPMTDLDVLVHLADFDRVAEMLRVDGFLPVRDLASSNTRTIRTQTIWLRSLPSSAAIHLHWHLIDSGYYARHVPIEWFWDRTTDATIGTRIIRVFSLEAQLLYLAAHLELHHAGKSLLRLYDIAILIDKAGDSLDWDIVLNAAQRFEWSQSVRRTIQRTQTIFGVTVPDSVNLRLSQMRSSLHERIAFALAEDEAHPAAFLFDGWEQKGWRQKLRYWLRSLFPSQEFMTERHDARGRANLFAKYILRLGRGLYRIPQALFAGLSIFWHSRNTASEDRFSDVGHY